MQSCGFRFAAQLAAVLLCLALLAGCGAASSIASEPASENGLHMTQSASVRKTTYENQADFAEFLTLAQPAFLIPGLNESMIPQGMDYCASNGLLYISGYYASGGLPSTLVAVEAASGEFVAEYYLYNPDGSPFDSHVGGVAVTDSTLYLSAKLDSDGSYSIGAIPLEELPVRGSHSVRVERTIPLPVSPSFLSFSQGVLWVGNFYHPGADYGLPPEINYTTPSADGDCGCYILGYDLSGGEEARLTTTAGGRYPLPDWVLTAPDKIQGMVLCADGTVTLSQSYGRKNNSSLLRYTLSLQEKPDTAVVIDGQSFPAYVLDSARLRSSVTAMPMTEALTDGPEGVLVLFESGASHYSNGSYRTDHVWSLHFPS